MEGAERCVLSVNAADADICVSPFMEVTWLSDCCMAPNRWGGKGVMDEEGGK